MSECDAPPDTEPDEELELEDEPPPGIASVDIWGRTDSPFERSPFRSSRCESSLAADADACTTSGWYSAICGTTILANAGPDQKHIPPSTTTEMMVLAMRTALVCFGTWNQRTIWLNCRLV